MSGAASVYMRLITGPIPANSVSSVLTDSVRDKSQHVVEPPSVRMRLKTGPIPANSDSSVLTITLTVTLQQTEVPLILNLPTQSTCTPHIAHSSYSEPPHRPSARSIPCLSCHLPACLRTSEASFSTFLTVLSVMLLALVPASFTSIGTDPAYFSGIHAVRGHGLSRKITNIRALSIQSYAFLHHRNILLLQTCGVTMVASYHTAQAFLDAFLKRFV